MSHIGDRYSCGSIGLAIGDEPRVAAKPFIGGAMPAKIPSKIEVLSKELLVLYDEFSEFDACCAFFCEATASMSGNSDCCLDGSSAEGLRILAQHLKERSATLKGQVEAVWKVASSEERH